MKAGTGWQAHREDNRLVEFTLLISPALIEFMMSHTRWTSLHVLEVTSNSVWSTTRALISIGQNEWGGRVGNRPIPRLQTRMLAIVSGENFVHDPAQGRTNPNRPG